MDLVRSSAADLLSALASRQLSAESLMGATLDRIAEVNPKVNAIVALRDADILMQEARACDAGPVRGA